MGADPTPAAGYRHVVCCVETEKASRRAIEEAVRIAGLGGSRLSIVHVVNSAGRFTGGRTSRSRPPDLVQEDLVEAALAWLRPIAERHGGEAVALTGHDGPERLKAWARAEEADLIVACPHRRGFARLLGSFAKGVLRSAPCPVLLTQGSRTGRRRRP